MILLIKKLQKKNWIILIQLMFSIKKDKKLNQISNRKKNKWKKIIMN